jgi:hypothetical protein
MQTESVTKDAYKDPKRERLARPKLRILCFPFEWKAKVGANVLSRQNFACQSSAKRIYSLERQLTDFI